MTNLSKELCYICNFSTLFFNPENETLARVYPDFKKAENFVKLLKIANDVLGSVHFATAYTKNKPNIFEEQALMHYLPIAKLNEAFKQAIRETEWVYG